MWEIIDDNGTIHNGTEEEMQEAFNVMTNNDSERNEIDKWDTDWTGDLKLIQIHNIYR